MNDAEAQEENDAEVVEHDAGPPHQELPHLNQFAPFTPPSHNDKQADQVVEPVAQAEPGVGRQELHPGVEEVVVGGHDGHVAHRRGDARLQKGDQPVSGTPHILRLESGKVCGLDNSSEGEEKSNMQENR